MHPALVRAAESAITYFLVVFIVLSAGLLKAVNLNDNHAVWSALSAAALGAIVATIKELTGFSTLRVTRHVRRRR